MSSRRFNTIAVVLVMAICAVAEVRSVPVPDTEDFDNNTGATVTTTKSPRIPKISEQDFKDLGVDEDYDDPDPDDPDYLTWEDLGRMIYSWAKLVAEPQQLKPLRKCLTGNAPRDAAQLIKRVESCVRIVEPDNNNFVYLTLRDAQSANKTLVWVDGQVAWQQTLVTKSLDRWSSSGPLAL